MTTQRSMWWGMGCGLLICVIFFAPASWLTNRLTQTSNGQLQLHDPRGTIWHGSAQVTLAGGSGSAGAMTLPSRVFWRLTAPITSSTLGASLAVTAECCIAKSPLQLQLMLNSLGLGQARVDWMLDVAQLELPADILTGLGAPWNTLVPAGLMRFSSQQLQGQWSSQEGLSTTAGQASLLAQNMQTALSTVKPLGNYRLQLQDTQLTLSTDQPDDAALVLRGTGQITQGRLQFRGEAVAQPAREVALDHLLHIIGQKQASADGRQRSQLAWGSL